MEDEDEVVENTEQDELELELDDEVVEEEAPEEELVEINYRGNPVKLSKEQLIALSQKGFDYENKMAALKETSADYAGYEAMRDWMEENPDKAEKIQAIIQGQETEIAPKEEEQDEDWLTTFDEDEEDIPKKKQRTESDAELQALKRQVAEMRAEREAKKAEQQTKAMGEFLQNEVAKYPELVEFGELAFAPILGVLASRPDVDPAQVVKVVAAQYKDKLKEIRGGYVKKKKESLEHVPLDKPQGSNPTILRKKTFSGKDLDTGDLRRAVFAKFNQNEE